MYVCMFGFKGASTSKVIGARNEMMRDDYDGQMMRDKSKINVFCAISKMKLHGPFSSWSAPSLEELSRHAGEMADTTDE